MNNTPAQRNVLDQWIEAVNSGDLEGLLDLYHDSAILLPTFQNDIFNSREQIRGYFSMLSQFDDLSVALEPKSLVAHEVSDHVAAFGGAYDWRWHDEDGQAHRRARFSFFVDTRHTQPILHHHSSEFPGR